MSPCVNTMHRVSCWPIFLAAWSQPGTVFDSQSTEFSNETLRKVLLFPPTSYAANFIMIFGFTLFVKLR